MNFGKCAVLQIAGAQVVQDQDRYCGGEGAIRKWQSSCIALHDTGAAIFLSQPRNERVVGFETGHARNAFS